VASKVTVEAHCGPHNVILVERSSDAQGDMQRIEHGETAAFMVDGDTVVTVWERPKSEAPDNEGEPEKPGGKPDEPPGQASKPQPRR
jgi:hypothetical protein